MVFFDLKRAYDKVPTKDMQALGKKGVLVAYQGCVWQG